jgi:hypothetical protein
MSAPSIVPLPSIQGLCGSSTQSQSDECEKFNKKITMKITVFDDNLDMTSS